MLAPAYLHQFDEGVVFPHLPTCTILLIGVGGQWLGCMQAAVSADGSDPREVKQWHQQQAAESELAAAEEAMKAGHKVSFLMSWSLAIQGRRHCGHWHKSPAPYLAQDKAPTLSAGVDFLMFGFQRVHR